MDLKPNSQKIILWRKSKKPENAGAWVRLSKALKSFAELEEIETDIPIDDSALNQANLEGKKIILELELADATLLANKQYADLTLVSESNMAWHDPKLREIYLPVFTNYSCLILDGISASDLLRLLHLYLFPKKNLGVSPLMEKGSLILGEKVQGLDSVGILLDRFALYLNQIENLELKARINDFRQTVTAFLSEAFKRASEMESVYPTIDFQASASPKKIALNFRFPCGNATTSEITKTILTGENLRWHILWQSCDVLLITHRVVHKEIEAHALFFQKDSSPITRFKSLLHRKSNDEAKLGGLMSSPKDYKFAVFSEMKIQKTSVQENHSQSDDEVGSNLNIDSLPAEVVHKINKFEKENAILREFSAKKDREVSTLKANLVQASKELEQGKNNVARLESMQVQIQESAQRKVAELEKRIELIQRHSAESNSKLAVANSSDKSDKTGELQASISNLESGLKAAEREKTQLADKLQQEQKRASLIEQKNAALIKDFAVKDKEAQEIKALMLKMKKEIESSNASAQEGSGAKLKEFEQREAALKQELKKLQFKLDTHEKTVKAQQTESAEKAKLMEQKLQEAKAKEIDLLKKIDELSSALKKAMKAA